MPAQALEGHKSRATKMRLGGDTSGGVRERTAGASGSGRRAHRCQSGVIGDSPPVDRPSLSYSWLESAEVRPVLGGPWLAPAEFRPTFPRIFRRVLPAPRNAGGSAQDHDWEGAPQRRQVLLGAHAHTRV